MNAWVVQLAILVSFFSYGVYPDCVKNNVKCSKDADCCNVKCVTDAPTRYCQLNLDSFTDLLLTSSEKKVSEIELMEIVEDYVEKASSGDLRTVRSFVNGNDNVPDFVKELLGFEDNPEEGGSSTSGGEASMVQEMLEQAKRNPELAKQVLSDPDLRAFLIAELQKPENIEKIKKYVKENPQILMKALNYAKKNPETVDKISKMLTPYQPMMYEKLDAYLDEHLVIRAGLVGFLSADPEAREILAKLLGKKELYKLMSPVNSVGDIGVLAGKGLEFLGPAVLSIARVTGKGIAVVGPAVASSENMKKVVNAGVGLVDPTASVNLAKIASAGTNLLGTGMAGASEGVRKVASKGVGLVDPTTSTKLVGVIPKSVKNVFKMFSK